MTRYNLRSKVLEVLKTINWSYGRGEVVSVNLDNSVATRRVPVSQSGGFSETRNFELIRKGDRLTVRFLGHQKTIVVD